MEMPLGQNRFDSFATILVLIALSSLFLIAAIGPVRSTLLNFIPDDAFYYFELARRMALGQGPTVDGINRTNGYHPLWLLVLLPFGSMMNVSREIGLRFAMTLGIFMLAAAVFIMRTVAARLVPNHTSLALLVPASALTFAAIYGLESPLAAFLLSVMLWQIARFEKSQNIKSAVAVGLFAGLLVLARLDSAVYVLALDLSWAASLWRTNPAESCRRSLNCWIVCLLVQTIVVTPYLAFNLIAFGHLLPISAMLKSERTSGPNIVWARSLLALIAIAGLSIGLIASWLQPGVRKKIVWQTALMGSASILIVNLIAGGPESYSWYFTLPVLCTGLFACVTANWFVAKRFVLLTYGCALLACGAILAFSIRGRFSEPQFASRWDRAKWIAAHAPPEAIFAEGNCGILGYISEHSFINLDGLTNSFSYQKAVRENQVASWLKEAGVNAAARPASETMEPLNDGLYRKVVFARADVQRQILLTLGPWDSSKPDSEYRLWRILNIDSHR